MSEEVMEDMGGTNSIDTEKDMQLERRADKGSSLLGFYQCN
jgi:hypothetical protein